MNLRKIAQPIVSATLLWAALAIGGCGYHFASSGAALPADAKTIYVKHFKNYTRDTVLADQFDRYLKDEIARHKRLDVVDDPSQADLTLSGTLLSQREQPAAFNGVAEPTEYYVMTRINAMLKDNRTHKVLWSTSGLYRQEPEGATAQGVVPTSPLFLQYNLRGQNLLQMPDIQLRRTQANMSRSEAMQQLAQDVYVNMSEGF